MINLTLEDFKKVKPKMESNEFIHLKCLDQGLVGRGKA